jgi:hypothetical protein
MGKFNYTVYSCCGRTRHLKSMPCKESNFGISVCIVLRLFYTLQFAAFIYRFAPVLHTSVRCIYSPPNSYKICGASKDILLRIALTLLVVQISRAVGSGFGILRLVTAVNLIILFSSLLPTQRHTVTGVCMRRIRRLLMMGARVPETCRAE